MSEGLKPDAYRWIVVIQKNHRGPFNLEEVKALLSQGIIRHNDVAIRMLADNQKDNSGWKFLWQFSEFDRRTEPRDEASPKAHEDGKPASAIIPPAARHERKGHIEDEALKTQVFAQLPRDLFEVGFSGGGMRQHAVSGANALAMSPSLGASPGAGNAPAPRTRSELEAAIESDGDGSFLPKLAGAFVVLLLVYFGSRFLSSTDKGSAKPQPQAATAPEIAKPPQGAVLASPRDKALPHAPNAAMSRPVARPFTPPPVSQIQPREFRRPPGMQGMRRMPPPGVGRPSDARQAPSRNAREPRNDEPPPGDSADARSGDEIAPGEETR